MLVKNFITIMFCYQWWWNKVSYIRVRYGFPAYMGII